ncbi:MAG: hypothetical protein IH849_09420 [Acidobacteria bacterium]|nr:hypothetical protein [Acidobacteriota bacterium]
MVVEVETDAEFVAREPELLVNRRYSVGYDIHPDGDRFLMLDYSSFYRDTPLSVVLNWFEELKQRVPTG